MREIDTILLLEESKKQTVHLRAIRNWVAFAGIMFIVIPILFWLVVVVGIFGVASSL